MKIGIMQPYFFPYIGYFSLINSTDFWVVFDTPQFIRHGWIERNRILKPGGADQYIKVPLIKASRNTSIQDMRINNTSSWEEKIYAQLTLYKKKAPFYKGVLDLLKEVLSYQGDSIVELNINGLKAVCKYLNIPFNYSIYSHLDLDIQVDSPDEWALEIAKHYKATTYINPENGMSFFDSQKYKDANVELLFQKMRLCEYKQIEGTFIPGLSIIDVMMFNSPAEIKTMLTNFELIKN